MRNSASFFSLGALFCALTFSGSATAQSDTVAIRAGQLFTGETTIANGTLIIEHGEITAIGGSDLEIPYEAILHEYPDATLFAGFLEANTSSGMDRSNEGVPIAPFLNVRDSINPVATYYEDMLRAGTVAIGVIPGNNTVIGGQGRVVMPHGLTLEEMTLSDHLGMKIAISPKSGWSRSSQMAELREAFDALDSKLRRIGQAKADQESQNGVLAKHDAAPDKDKDDGDGYDSIGGVVRFGDDFPGKALISEEDLGEVEYGLLSIRNGEERIWLTCNTASDVVHGRKWVEQMGLLDQTVFVIQASAWKAAEHLAGAGLGVVLVGALWDTEYDPVTWKEVETFAPLALYEAGVRFAMTSHERVLGPNSLAYRAAQCIREGVPRSVALDAVTTFPAELWGLSGKVGSLAVGADGTFVLFNADPLETSGRVQEVWMRGQRVYERATDERLQRLTEEH